MAGIVALLAGSLLLLPATAEARDAGTLDWVREHRSALGLTAAAVDGLQLAGRTTGPSGLTHVRYRQARDGIPAFDGGLRLSLDRAGRVLSARGSPVAPGAPQAPRLGPEAALQALQRDVGVVRPVEVVSGPSGVRRTTRFAGGDFARLVLFGSGRGTRTAWHLTYRAGPLAHYDAVVDASTGAVLFWQNLVKDAAAADVFRSHPAQGAQVAVDLQQRGWLGAGANILNGPYAHVYADLNDDNAASASEEIQRTSGGDFRFSFAAFGGDTCIPTALCSWDSSQRQSWQTNRARTGVQAFYLVNRFRDHLATDPDIGFAGFAGTDAVRVETDDGAALGHLNNASMATLPEGLPPLMQLYLFDDEGFRTANAADSAAIVWHEYTHGLSSRLVTHDDGSAALASPQAAALAEGLSDWYALDLLVGDGLLVDGPAPGQVDLGHYVDHLPHTLRRQGLDCPVGVVVAVACPAGGLTYGDLAGDVHDDGEIWAATLWDLRAAVGRDVAQALITEGQRMAPPEPSFLDLRNAILAAEAGLPGDHRDALWTVFARRGMGYRAHTEGAAELSPVEDFRLPPSAGSPRGLTTGTVTSAESGLPLANVSVGFGAAVFPDLPAARTAANGSYALDAPAGGYNELAFEHAGYDRVAIPGFEVPAGGTRVQDVALRRNWAAAGGGAVVRGGDDRGAVYGCGLARLIDQKQASGWSAAKPASAVVELPEAIDVTGFGLDPTNACGDGAGASTARFRVETSADGDSFATALDGTFGASHRGRLTVLRADVRNVRYVRLTLLSSQDPSSPYVDFSELEVFGAPPNRLPRGSLAASRARIGVGGKVKFAAAFADPDSRIVGYDWDFDGDGAVDRSTTEPATSFTYRRAGTFAAGVAVRDFRGGAGTAARTVTVTRPPRPVLRLPRRARRRRVKVRVTCAQRCTVTARLRVGHRTIRRSLRVTGRRSITLVAPRGAGRARVVVIARYADGRSTRVRRTVRL